MLHAALLLWVAGAGHLLHGNVDLHAMAWLLVGSIPGVLIGSHLSIRVPERALRIAFGVVLILSGIKIVERARRAIRSSSTARRARRARAPRLVGPPLRRAAARSAGSRRTTPRRIARAWPGSCRRRSSSPCSRRPPPPSRSPRARSSSARRSTGRSVDPGLLAGRRKAQAGRARSRFRLRTRERVDVWIRTRDGDTRRDARCSNRTRRRGRRLDLVWDGFSDGGVARARTASTGRS